MDPDLASGSLAPARFEEDIVLVGGCSPTTGCGAKGGGCAPIGGEYDIEVGIWRNPSAAEEYVTEYQDALNPGERLVRIRNASIDWKCRATKNDKDVIGAALR